MNIGTYAIWEACTEVDLYNEVNKPLVELILGLPVEESNREQVEVEMGTKMFMFQREFTQLIKMQERKFGLGLDYW